MKITGIDTRYFRLPIETPADDASHGLMDTVELVTVVIQTDEGIQGDGYAYTIGHGGRAIKALIDHDLAPMLINRDPHAHTQCLNDLWWGIHWVGRGGLAAFAIAALDIALWDIRAIAAGLPLYRFLGGSRRPIPAYGSGVDLSLGAEPLAKEIRHFVDEGFNAVKVKIGSQSLADDQARLAVVRETLGPEGDLMVDANMRWSAAEAIKRCRILSEFDLAWIEEPVIPEDVAGHRAVKEALGIPIATGENLHSRYEFQRYLEAGAVDIVQIDVITAGGITEWLRIAQAAEMCNLPVSTHYAQEIQVHLLASIPNAHYCERHMYRMDKYLQSPLVVENGHFLLPEEPGHGMRFDQEALRPCAGD